MTARRGVQYYWDLGVEFEKKYLRNRDLLVKYIEHVAASEGTDFLDNYHRYPVGSDIEFSEEEWAELRYLSGREHD